MTKKRLKENTGDVDPRPRKQDKEQGQGAVSDAKHLLLTIHLRGKETPQKPTNTEPEGTNLAL